MTGFTENVELGQIGQIQKSSEVVMRVKVEGDAGTIRESTLARHRAYPLRRLAVVGLAMERQRIYQDTNGWFIFPTASRWRTPAAL